MDIVLVFKQSQSNRVNRSITPTLIKESTGTIEMIKVVLVGLASPEFQIGNFEIRPEMTGGVSICNCVLFWPQRAVYQPIHRIILVNIFRVSCEELLGLRPQSRNALGCIKQVDCEAVGFVMVIHISEDIVVDVTKEVNLRFNPPVVTGVRQSGVFVEYATVPPTHLMIRHHFAILNALFFEDFRGFVEQVPVDPFGDIPMFFRDNFYSRLLV